MAVPKSKVCTKCKVRKLAKFFYQGTRLQVAGPAEYLSSMCKPCKIKQARKSFLANSKKF